MAHEKILSRILQPQVAQIRKYGALLVKKKGGETLHDARVSVRRAQSIFKAFRSHLDSKPAQKISDRFRKFLNATSHVRDFEVMIEWLERQGKIGGDFSKRLIAMLRVRVEKFRNRVAPGVGRDLIIAADELMSLVRTLSGTVDAARLYPIVLTKQSRKVKRALQKLAHSESARAEHRVRIRIKQLRYLVEGCPQQKARGIHQLKRLRQIQDTLGALHDRTVLLEFLNSRSRRDEFSEEYTALIRKIDQEKRELRKERKRLLRKV